MHTDTATLNIICRGARDILETYWEKLGGKPIPAEAKSASKKRSRQSTGGSGTPDTTAAKKQKKSAGRKSKDASANDDKTGQVPYPFTDVGADTWQVPKMAGGAWDSSVQSVDTIEKDDQGVLWAFLVWNDKNEDGRYYRSKAKLTTCNKCCPQRVGFSPSLMQSIALKQRGKMANFRSFVGRCWSSTRSMCKFLHTPTQYITLSHFRIDAHLPNSVFTNSRNTFAENNGHAT